MIYLASPYSSPDISVRQERYILANSFTVRVLKHSIPIFSPIVYGRDMEDTIGTDYLSWQTFNDEMVRICSHFWVLTLKDWETSRGVNHEIALATLLGKSVRYVTMNEALT